MNKLMNISQLSEYVNLPKNTLYSWIFQRKIPFLKISRLVKFDRKEIDEWLKKHKKEVQNHSTLRLQRRIAKKVILRQRKDVWYINFYSSPGKRIVRAISLDKKTAHLIAKRIIDDAKKLNSKRWEKLKGKEDFIEAISFGNSNKRDMLDSEMFKEEERVNLIKS